MILLPRCLTKDCVLEIKNVDYLVHRDGWLSGEDGDEAEVTVSDRH